MNIAILCCGFLKNCHSCFSFLSDSQSDCCPELMRLTEIQMGGCYWDPCRYSAVDETNKQEVCDKKVNGDIFCVYFVLEPSFIGRELWTSGT
jgi:hypothetical protein